MEEQEKEKLVQSGILPPEKKEARQLPHGMIKQNQEHYEQISKKHQNRGQIALEFMKVLLAKESTSKASDKGEKMVKRAFALADTFQEEVDNRYLKEIATFQMISARQDD